MSKLAQTTNAIEKWVESVMYDQAIGYEEAFEVVMAKIRAKISENKRQLLFFADSKFRVRTLYSDNEKKITSQIEGQPHVEVLDEGVKIGCIMIENEAIMELISLFAPQNFLFGFD